MSYRTVALALTTILAISSCGDPAAPLSTSAKAVGLPETSRAALEYKTRVGTFYVQLPSNYVSVSDNSSEQLSAFQKPLVDMKLVDVFVEQSDLDRTKTTGELLQHQYVQLQLYPEDMPRVSDANWGVVREHLVSGLSSSTGKIYVQEGLDKTMQIVNEQGSSNPLMGMSAGDIVVYSNTEQGESPRVLRRLQLLREWSHEQIEQVFPGSA